MPTKRRSTPTLTKAQQRRVVNKATRELVKVHTKAGTLPTLPGSTTKTPAPVHVPVMKRVKDWRIRQNTWRRNIKSLRPHLWTGLWIALGEALYYASRYMPSLQDLVALLATLGGGAALIAIHTKVTPRDRIWGDAYVVGAGVWLTWCTGRGVDSTIVAVLIFGECVLATRWWPRHRKPYPEADVAHVGETVPEAWGKYVATAKGQLPGVPLTDFQQTKNTDQWTVMLHRDGATVQEVYGKLPKIAHALNKRLEDVIWERHPSINYAGNLQVVTVSPIKKPVMFDQPRFDGGAILLGPYADGRGEARLRVYTDNSMWSSYLFGSTGVGKSRLIESIAISLRARGDTVIFNCDGQNGASSSAIRKHCTWYVDSDEFGIMLDALEAIARARQEKLVHDDVPGFEPSPEYPGIMVIIDEMHVMMRTAAWAKRLADLARSTRKIGIGFIGASQYSGLGVFGGLEELRSSMLSGNGIAMHTDSRIAGQLVPGLALDPAELPKIAGYGYTIASEEDNYGRTAPFRSRWLLSDTEKTKMGRDDLHSVIEWMGVTPEPEVDVMSANAAGAHFLDRQEIAQRNREALAARVEGRMAGQDIPAKAIAPKQEGAGGGFLPKVPHFGDPAPTVSYPSDLTEAERNVFVAVAKGYVTPKDIAAYTRLSLRHVNTQLAALMGREPKILDKDGAAAMVTYFLPDPEAAPQDDEEG